MGLKSGSSKSTSSKTEKSLSQSRKKARTPARKYYKSKSHGVSSSHVLLEDVTSDEEEEPFHDAPANINEEETLMGSDRDVVPDAEASAPQDTNVSQENPIPENPDVEDVIAEETVSTETPSSSKKGDKGSVSSKETHSDEPIQVLVQNNSDGDDSDDDDVPLFETLPESVGARLKRKRRTTASEAPSVPQKKTKPSPTTPKSKKKDLKGKGKATAEKSMSEKKKKAPVIVSESDSDVEADVPDIVLAEMKKFAGRRIPKNVPAAPLDNVSFHSEENALKWKYVYQRRLATEREVGSDVLECKEVMALIEKAGLIKTVLQVGRCFERLVKEFVVNLSVEVGLPESDEYRKVYVREKCVKFSPDVINKALGRSATAVTDEEPSLDVVAKELTAGQVQKWPKKKLLSTCNLSVKYAILNRIGAVNWVPTQHTSAISATLARLIYKIGTMVPVDFGNFVFEQTLKHAETCAVKLPIYFPSLITEIILQQHPKIVRDDEEAMPKGSPITLDHRFFYGPHVPDIDVPSNKTFASVPVSKSGRRAIIDELQAVSKALQETITASTARKVKVDELLLKLQEEEDQ
ncbi:uncharacterized protein LOC130719746 [Lotus japonicus]|uniref:uncharacterized protein LOC130719746 n=1 Tax=Lotus japonicus TaxID=34305 RepID=UPI002586FB5B|nr:uncharacterized protein LOC130719746 [Lotus japonicus]